MSIIKEYEAGDTAQFKTVFRDTQGDVVEPDGTEDVEIEITDLSADEVIVSSAEMKEVSDTEFVYNWQTTEGMSLGEYEVEVTGVFQGDDALNRDIVKLVRTKEHGS